MKGRKNPAPTTNEVREFISHVARHADVPYLVKESARALLRTMPGDGGWSCPNCGVSFDGGEIPERIRQHYSPPFRWSRRIAIIDSMRDRVVSFRCPDCKHEWSP